MNIHTKEFLQDCLSLIGNITLVVVLAYVVFILGHSAWWFLTLFIFRFRFVPEEYIEKRYGKEGEDKHITVKSMAYEITCAHCEKTIEHSCGSKPTPPSNSEKEESDFTPRPQGKDWREGVRPQGKEEEVKEEMKFYS